MDDAFYVDHSVLIPRPETEELVQLILNQQNQHALKVLDIGTGSGAIAVNLSKHRNNWSIYACDVSNEALVVARRNGSELLKNTEVAFYQEDILQPKSFYTSGLDVIVSNPPYVLETDKSDMQEQVLKHEPHTALFVSNDNPLLFYNAIVMYASDNLKQSGALYFEVHELYADKVAQLLSASDYLNVKVYDDLQGKPRMVSGLKS
jgi:release factor glutamine methyltransferase